MLTKHLETQPKTVNKELSIHDQDHLHLIQHPSPIPQTHDVDDWSYFFFRICEKIDWIAIKHYLTKIHTLRRKEKMSLCVQRYKQLLASKSCAN